MFKLELKFFVCKNCGNLVVMSGGGGCAQCCGEELKELIPSTAEGAAEKHLPVCQVEGNRVSVSVGSVDHPMTEEHSIRWVALQTRQGGQFKTLQPGRAPTASFALCDADEVEAAYAYCNLHGLWKSQ